MLLNFRLPLNPVEKFHYLYGFFLWLQTVWILISWLHQKPADLDLHSFQKTVLIKDRVLKKSYVLLLG